MMPFFLVGILLCAVAAGLAVKHRPRATIQPLDVEAFRALPGRADEMFLRKTISLAAFLRLKCQRICVSGRYIRRIANNAKAYILLCVSVHTAANSEIAAAASSIVNLGAR